MSKMWRLFGISGQFYHNSRTETDDEKESAGLNNLIFRTEIFPLLMGEYSDLFLLY